MRKNIKAILIDSGRVLNEPVTGHWFIAPNFYSFVERRTFISIPRSKRKHAFSLAGEYISKQPLISSEEDEYKHFLEYYRIFFGQLQELKICNEDIEGIARDLVYNHDKYKFYKDAVEMIPFLSQRYKLALVSDAWPSLDKVFRKAGLREYFSSFIISSQKGISKPHEMMYKSALEELGAEPCEAVFIDDNVRNCDGAAKLGIEAYVLSREPKLYLYNALTCKRHTVIRNLSGLKRGL